MNGIAGDPMMAGVDASTGRLGVDIGSLYVKLVWIGPDGTWHSECEEHQGRPVATLRTLLRSAGVPTRMPEVTKGDCGSFGTAFLLTVMLAAPSQASTSFPVRPAPMKLTRNRWSSVPPDTTS